MKNEYKKIIVLLFLFMFIISSVVIFKPVNATAIQNNNTNVGGFTVYNTTIDWQNYTLPNYNHNQENVNANTGAYRGGMHGYNIPIFSRHNVFNNAGFIYQNTNNKLVFYDIQNNTEIILTNSWHNLTLYYKGTNGWATRSEYFYTQYNNGSMDDVWNWGNVSGYMWLQVYFFNNNTYYYANSTILTNNTIGNSGYYGWYQLALNATFYYSYRDTNSNDYYIGYGAYVFSFNKGLILNSGAGLADADTSLNSLQSIPNIDALVVTDDSGSSFSGTVTASLFALAKFNFNTNTFSYYMVGTDQTTNNNNPWYFIQESNGTYKISQYENTANGGTSYQYQYAYWNSTSNTWSGLTQITVGSQVNVETMTNNQIVSNSGIISGLDAGAITGATPTYGYAPYINYSNKSMLQSSNSWFNEMFAKGLTNGTSFSPFINVMVAGYNNYEMYIYPTQAINNSKVTVYWLPAYTKEFLNSVSKYNIELNESGLPAGTSWTYTFNGTQSTINTDQTNLSEPNGTYSFSVSNINGYTVSYSSSIVVSGANQVVNVVFKKIPTYKVQLFESGLPTGTNWNYTFNHNSEVLGNSSYNYSLSNGTYSLYVGTVSGYSVNYPSSVIVSGSSQIVYINYTVIPTYALIVHESGLTNGTKWYILINNIQYSSIKKYDNVSNLLNGTYQFNVNNIAGYLLGAYPSSFVINGNTAYINLTYTPDIKLYSVDIIAHNIQDVSSVKWSVVFNTTTYFSQNSNTIIVPSLINDTYSLHVNSLNGYIIHAYTTSIVINGNNLTENIYFNQTFILYIKESGFNGQWFINFNGTSYSSTNFYLNITGLVNYTYSIDVVLPTSYNVNNYNHQVIINGKNDYVNLTFNKILIKQGYYEVEFIMSGLPKGMNYSVMINNEQYYSNGNIYLNITLVNGTYIPIISIPNNYVFSQSLNTLTVNGNNTVYPIYVNYQFNIWTYTPEILIMIVFLMLVILGAYLKRAI